MLAPANASNEACGSILDSLKTLNQAVGCTGQQWVAVVEPWRNKCFDYCLPCFYWQRLNDSAELVETAVCWLTYSSDLWRQLSMYWWRLRPWAEIMLLRLAMYKLNNSSFNTIRILAVCRSKLVVPLMTSHCKGPSVYGLPGVDNVYTQFHLLTHCQSDPLVISQT